MNFIFLVFIYKKFLFVLQKCVNLNQLDPYFFLQIYNFLPSITQTDYIPPSITQKSSTKNHHTKEHTLMNYVNMEN